MKFPLTRFLCLAVIVLAAACQANAQYVGPPPPKHIESLELFVSKAQTLIVGNVTNHIDIDWQFLEATINVEKVLKGQSGGEVKVRFMNGSTDLASLQKGEDTLLIAMPLDPAAACKYIDLSDPNLSVLTADLKLLRTRDEVLRSVDRLIRRNKPVRDPATFSEPLLAADYIKKGLQSIFAGKPEVTADVPVDERVERWARSAVYSKDIGQRLKAVDAIRFFKSRGNIEVLKSLLADPGFVIRAQAETNQGQELHFFAMRDAAYRLLSEWGEIVAKPVVDESVPRFDSIKNVTWEKPLTEPDLVRLEGAKHLGSIYLWRQSFTAHQLEMIAQIDSLEDIFFSDSSIPPGGLKPLQEMKNLKRISFQGVELSERDLADIAGIQGLKTATFYNSVTQDEFVALQLARPDVKIQSYGPMRPTKLQFLEPTIASCPRMVYSLGAPGRSLANWSSVKVGRLTGPIQWSRSPSGRSYIGPFGQQAVTLQLGALPGHKNVHVEIELWVIGSWDGDGSLGAGPDIIDIHVAGVGTAMHSTFFNNTEGSAGDLLLQSYPDPYPLGRHKGYTGADEVRSLGFTEPWDGILHHRDAVYKLQYTFAHNSSNFAITITGENVTQRGIRKLTDDENWGIGNILVKTD